MGAQAGRDEAPKLTERHLEATERALALLGFGPTDVKVYGTLLRTGPASAGSVAQHSGVSRGRIYEVLEQLRSKGIVTAHEGRVRTYSAYQPEIAFASAVQREQDALDAKRLLLAQLLPTLRGAMPTEKAERIEILHEDRDIANLQMLLFRRTRRSILLFEKRTLFPGQELQEVSATPWYAEKVRAMKRCADARLLVDRQILSEANLRKRMEGASALGLHLRALDDLPLHALVLDAKHVLINLPEAPKVPSNPQVYLRHPGLAAVLTAVFEDLWAKARPLTPSG